MTLFAFSTSRIGIPLIGLSFFVVGGRVHDIVRADDYYGVGLFELGVYVFEIVELTIGTPASVRRTFMCPGIRPATGWMPNRTSLPSDSSVSIRSCIGL
jgi:hypothetical protein